MSMRNLRANIGADMHQEAQRQALMAGFKAATLEKYLHGDRGGLHKKALADKGPNGEVVSTLKFLASEALSAGVGPTDAELAKAEKYWLRRLKVDEEREEVRAEKVRDYAHDRWCLEAIMQDAGMNLRGPCPSTVEKSFTTTSQLVIHPFFWDTAIQAGMLAMPVIDRLIMMDVPIDSRTAEHVELTDTDGDSGISEAGEGVTPTTGLLTATDRTIKLKKFLYESQATYESLKWARLPIFERWLERIGRRLMIMVTDLGFEVLIAGDGDSGAATTVATISAGNPVYKDLLSLEGAFGMGYMPDIIAATKETIYADILNMAEFKDPFTGFSHQTRGGMPSPVGMDLVRWDYTGRSTSYATTKVIMGQQGEMMIQYSSGGVLTETEDIISGQWHKVVASLYTNFAIWDRAACRVGTGW